MFQQMEIAFARKNGRLQLKKRNQYQPEAAEYSCYM